MGIKDKIEEIKDGITLVSWALSLSIGFMSWMIYNIIHDKKN